MSTETYSYYGIKQPSIAKTAYAILDYTFDWTEWLSGVSDTIASFEVVVDGATLDESAQVGTTIVAWVSGGVTGTVATIRCRIVTAGGRDEERIIYLIIKDR